MFQPGGGELLYVNDPVVQPPNIGPPTSWPTSQPQDEQNEHQQQGQIIPQDLMKKVKMAIPERPEPPTICKVPADLAKGNMSAYTPNVICIGPLFDNERTTASMLRLERYKWCCVRKLIVRCRHRPVLAAAKTLDELESAEWSVEEHEPLLGKCFETMMGLVPRFRASYSGICSSNGNEQQLAINMLLDGCFVLHRLLKFAQTSSREGNGGNDYDDDWTQLLGRCWIWGTVKRDLLLLSNQVPFFVLRKLFKQLTGEGDSDLVDDILVNGGLQLFSSLHPLRLHSAPISCHDVHHLLHLFYLSIDVPLESVRQQQHAALPSEELLAWWMPCAKELEEAGVRIRARKRGASSFLDVRFREGGILEIPQLQLFDYSEPLFRNLIAFEHTYPASPGRITAYAIFMDCLLKSTEDVRLLHQRGVLLNQMNGDRDDTASVTFFSRLCAGVHTSADRNYLAGVMVELDRYQRLRFPRWRAAMLRDYFASPYVTLSVIVLPLVFLVFTVMQTFYTIYPYYKPSKQ